MGEKLAMGFHTCVDYELKWDTKVLENQIKAFDIYADELDMNVKLDSERGIWIYCLAHLQAGIGGECVPDDSQLVVDFANRFDYEITLGGTPTRAAIVLDKLGFHTVLQTSCYNEHVKRLMPKRVNTLPGVAPDHDDIYPHVVLQCNGGVRIQANDIDFVTPRENRVMISRDIDSLYMPVLSDEFGKMITDAEVFLLGCFSEILDKDVLTDCVNKTKKLFSYLPEDAFVVLEDGCYVVEDFRYYVHEQLAPYATVLSMNEDELQDYYGKRIDILDVAAVKDAIEYVYAKCGVKTLLVHSAKWALAYGEKATIMEKALAGGIAMAATRFRIGDDITPEDYLNTMNMPGREDSVAFGEKLKELMGNNFCLVACKDLSFVENPTVVGLGDSFAGGILPGLMKENR